MFDSGVGGLTVLHECLVSLPHEDFLYLGDTARFPYGDRSPDELLRLRARARGRPGRARGQAARGGVQLGHRGGAAGAARGARAAAPPVIGVVTPEARLAARATRNGKVGLIATPATVASGAYARALAEAAPEAELHAVASAELAPLIQAGGEVDHRVLDCVEGACRPLRAAGVDTVILGCTHYPLVRPVLQRELGRGVTIVSSGEAIAEDVHATLERLGLANADGTRRGTYRFLASGDAEDFRRLGHPLPAAADRRGRARGPGGRAEGAGGGVSEDGARNDGRTPADLREVSISPGFMRSATGSALIEMGGTRVICTATRRRGGAALDGGPGPRLDHRRVRDAPRLDGRAEAARRLARAPGRAHRRDPAADRALAARRDRLRGPRRAHGLDRLRRARGRRRHALRRDHRRLRGARAGAAPAGGGGQARQGPAERVGGRRVLRGGRRRARCSTSTTPRTRAPRWTRTWS